MTLERQLEFDFPTQIKRDDYIRELDFTIHLAGERYAKHRGTVPIETIASVLKHIGKYPECYESQSRICLTLKIKVRKLQRAIAVLRDLDILTTERKPVQCGRGGTVNHHRINWEQVRRLVERQKRRDQYVSTDALIDQPSQDQHVSTDATNTSVLTDQHVSTDATNTSVQTPLLIKGIGREGSELETNLTPPSPPQRMQEEETGKSLVLIRTQKPRLAQALAAQSDESSHGLAQALAAQSVHADLVRRYALANVYDAAELLAWLLPLVGVDYLERLLAHWLANQSDWHGAGALRTRMKRSRPDLAIEAGWPPPKPKPKPELVTKRSSVDLAQQRAEHKRAREAAEQMAKSEPSMGELLRRHLREVTA